MPMLQDPGETRPLGSCLWRVGCGRQCSLLFRCSAECLCHVRRCGSQRWHRVREIVSERLCQDEPTSAALIASGVSEGSVCRALGCALHLLDGQKFELPLVQVEALGEHFRAGECFHMPGAQDVVECVSSSSRRLWRDGARAARLPACSSLEHTRKWCCL